MEQTMQNAINVRYSELAQTSCCLSCGGAINHGNARTGERCVDLGSGRGTDVLRLAETVGAGGFVYGIDISDGMLHKARRHAEQLGFSNVSFEKASLEALPIDSATIDLVISNCTINHADDKQQVWHEVFRMLRDGGRFVVSDIYATSPVPAEYRNDPAAVAECWAGSVTREEYIEQLRLAGFTEVRILEESEPYPKGSIEVVSWTIQGFKTPRKRCSCNK